MTTLYKVGEFVIHNGVEVLPLKRPINLEVGIITTNSSDEQKQILSSLVNRYDSYYTQRHRNILSYDQWCQHTDNDQSNNNETSIKSQLFKEYNEYRINQLSLIFDFDEWVEHVDNDQSLQNISFEYQDLKGLISD